MAVPVQSIVDAAIGEWTHWGKSTWNCITGKKSSGRHIDDEDEFAQYAIDNYVSLFIKPPIKWPTTSTIGNDDYAWSAVTISFILKKAGYTAKKLPPAKVKPADYAKWVESTKADEFPFSQAHADYIRWSIRARKDERKDAAYWGFRVDEADAKPEIGDLIGSARGTGMTKAKALKFFDKTSNYTSHSDIVVDKRPGEIDVIGGNVRDSVTKKTLALNSKGQLADAVHDWFVVMKRR